MRAVLMSRITHAGHVSGVIWLLHDKTVSNPVQLTVFLFEDTSALQSLREFRGWDRRSGRHPLTPILLSF
jgi:hypothetical protein